MGAAPSGAARAPALALLAAAGLAGAARAAAGPPACFADDAVSLIGLDRSFLQAPEAAAAPAVASREAERRRAIPGPAAALKAEEVAGFLDEAGIEPTEEEGIRVAVRDQQGRRWQVKADILRPLSYMLGTLCRRTGIREAGAVLMRGETRLNPFLTPELLRMQDGEVLTLVDELAPPPPPPPLTFLAALRSVAAGQARQPPAAAAVNEPGQDGSLRNALRRAILANPARNQTAPVLKKGRKKRKAYKSSAQVQAPYEDPRSDPHWVSPQEQEEKDLMALKNALHSKEREHHMKYQVPKDDWDAAIKWMNEVTQKPKRKPEEVEKELDRLTKSEDLQIQKEATDNMLQQANEGLSDNFEPNAQDGQQRTHEDLASPMQKENTEQGKRQEDEKKVEGKGGLVEEDKANENLLHERNQTEQEFKKEQQEQDRVGKDAPNGWGLQPQEEKAASDEERLQGVKEESAEQKSLQPELAPSPSQMVPKPPMTPSQKEHQQPKEEQKSLLAPSPSQAAVPEQPKGTSQKEQPQAHKEEPVEQKSLLAPSPSQAPVPEQPKAVSQKEQPQGLKEKQVEQRKLQQEGVSSQKQLPQKQKQGDADAKQRREDDGPRQQPQRPKQLADREWQGEGQQHLLKHQDRLESKDPSEQARTEEHTEVEVEPKKKEDKASGTRRREHEKEKAATEDEKAHARKHSAQEGNATGNMPHNDKNASKTGNPHVEGQQQQMLAPNQLPAKQNNSSSDVVEISKKDVSETGKHHEEELPKQKGAQNQPPAKHDSLLADAAKAAKKDWERKELAEGEMGQARQQTTDPEAAEVDEEEAPEPAHFRPPAPSYESWLDDEGVQSSYRTEVEAPEAEAPANATGTGDIFMKPLAELTPSERRERAELRAAAARDCVLSDWSDWSDCRKVRDDGMRVRYSKRWRQVVQPQRPGGKICPSGLISSRACLTKDTLREIRGLAELAYWPIELVDELLGNGAGSR